MHPKYFTLHEGVKEHIALRTQLCDKGTTGNFVLGILLCSILSVHTYAQPALPAPDHIVVLILENHNYHQIIGAPSAPYINALSNDPYTALFTESFGLERPSQPNYLDLYSGSNQGVTNNNVPPANPFNTPNLGRQLIDAGKTFTTYSEDLPYAGYNGPTSGHYARKHNPAANWMGSGINQISVSTNQPFSAFPASDFSQLPTVCFIMPNQNNDMHNGSDTARIVIGDTWVHDHLDAYIQWAKTNNSLFILTFDEDNLQLRNHIVTLMTGEMVKPGQYDQIINHYSVLRTIEDMYGLPYAGKAASVDPIEGCWNSVNAISETEENFKDFSLYPNPSDGMFMIQSNQNVLVKDITIEIFDLFGRIVSTIPYDGYFPVKVDLQNISSGIYLVSLTAENRTHISKIIIR